MPPRPFGPERASMGRLEASGPSFSVERIIEREGDRSE